jgi:peptidoglycan/xylan/chitin deacetylase (PgdA/CDA1 family)
MTIGFHTLRHDPLPSLADDALATALREGRAQLEEIARSQLRLIAYPHGRADARVAEAARKAGYRLGFTGAEEGVGPRSDRLRLGRIQPTYRPTGHFALQLLRSLLRAQR